jgi:hypothetical protein
MTIISVDNFNFKPAARVRSREKVKMMLIDAALNGHDIYHSCYGFYSEIAIDDGGMLDTTVWRYATDLRYLQSVKRPARQMRTHPESKDISLPLALSIVENSSYLKMKR